MKELKDMLQKGKKKKTVKHKSFKGHEYILINFTKTRGEQYAFEYLLSNKSLGKKFKGRSKCFYTIAFII